MNKQQLDLLYINDIKQLCTIIYDIIKTNRMMTYVIQYNKGILNIGKDSEGRFCPIYYNHVNHKADVRLKLILEYYRNMFENLMKKIQINKPLTKSYNIFHNVRDNVVYVCRNAIGNVSIHKSLLYEPIKL